MQVTVTVRDIQLPEMVQQLLRTKVEKFDRFGSKSSKLHAIFGKEKYLYTAELILSTKGARLTGRSKHPKDILTSMEEALEKLERQLKTRQDKQTELPRRRAPHRPA